MKMLITNLDECNPFSTDIVNARGEMIRILIPPLTTAEVVNIDPFFLNQDKILRNAVFKTMQLSVSFAAEPDDLVSLSFGGGGGGFNRTDRPLIATGDPRIFTTTETFLHIPGTDLIEPLFSIEVFSNQLRQRQTKTQNPADGDYFVWESGGAGTGYDTIEFLSFVPNSTTRLRVNYQAV